MPWPLAASYTAMVQNPKVAFKDKELQTCTIKRDATNLPFGIAGQFAVVYKGTFPNGRAVAVRAFTSDKGKDRNERYHVISDYLSQHNQVKSLVHFQYHDKGIRASDGKMYPLVTMEWVPGVTLFEWVRNACTQRDQRQLIQSVDRWVELVNELSDAQIAHGDLQHANVMVTERNELKLVDYDCMCVPQLVGLQNLEIGVDPYQHPERDASTQLTPDLDNFSSIFILVALRALAASPDLWGRFVEQTRYDKLLIRREDFDNPGTSELYRALQSSPDGEVQRLARDLFELWRVRMHEVPNLKQVLFSYDRIRSLLSQKNFDEAVALLTRQKSVKDAPPDLQPLIQNARERVQCRQALEPKVRAGDEAGMKQYYVPRLLDDWPAARGLADVARHAGTVLQLLQQLQAARQQQQWENLVAVWDGHAALLDSRTSPQVKAFKSEVVLWREKNQLRDSVLALLRQTPCDHRRLAQAWQRLTQLQGHPQVQPLQPQIDLAIRRGEAWESFAAVARAPGEQNDAQLDRGWQESLFAKWPPAEAQRPAVDQARQRLQTVRQLRQAAQQTAAPTPAGEQQLFQLGRKLPAGYGLDPTLQQRVEQARQRLQAYQRVRGVVAQATTDVELAAAGAELARLQVRHWLDPANDQRVRLAELRAPLLEQLQQLAANLPLDELDHRLLDIWKEDVLKDCPAAQPWRAKHQTAVARRALLDRLEAAVRVSDENQVAALAADPLLQGYPLSRGLSDSVALIRQGLEGTQRLIGALRSGDRAEFRAAFDPEVIRRYGKMLAPYRQPLLEFLRGEILPAEKMGLKPYVLKRQSLTRGTRNTWELRWSWPDRHWSERCYVGICRQQPRGDRSPRELALPEALNVVTRDAFEQGGGKWVIHPKYEWNSGYVVVWAVLDVGFDQLFSEPLILGRLELAAPGQRPGGKRGFL
jgi:serine/threonine protein kinase